MPGRVKSPSEIEAEDRIKHPELYHEPVARCGVCHELIGRENTHSCTGCGTHVWNGKNGRYFDSKEYDGIVVECWKCWRARKPKPQV